jgi:hypothetical protein
MSIFPAGTVLRHGDELLFVTVMESDSKRELLSIVGSKQQLTTQIQSTQRTPDHLPTNQPRSEISRKGKRAVFSYPAKLQLY